MHFKGDPVYEHHVKTYGDPAEFGYHDFVPKFTAEHFDPEEWADLFQKADARFAGPVAGHHDGFSMWTSKVNPWDVADMGPKRDITGELAGLAPQTQHASDGHLPSCTQPPAPRPAWRALSPPAAFRNSHYPPIEGWPTSTDDPQLSDEPGQRCDGAPGLWAPGRLK